MQTAAKLHMTGGNTVSGINKMQTQTHTYTAYLAMIHAHVKGLSSSTSLIHYDAWAVGRLVIENMRSPIQGMDLC